jgi:hypothetical protein
VVGTVRAQERRTGLGQGSMRVAQVVGSLGEQSAGHAAEEVQVAEVVGALATLEQREDQVLGLDELAQDLGQRTLRVSDCNVPDVVVHLLHGLITETTLSGDGERTRATRSHIEHLLLMAGGSRRPVSGPCSTNSSTIAGQVEPSGPPVGRHVTDQPRGSVHLRTPRPFIAADRPFGAPHRV